MIYKSTTLGSIDTIDSSTLLQVVNGYQTVSILGGEFAIIKSDKKIAIKTLLGSCVSMMFFDNINNIISMNHYLLPDGSINSSLKYGLSSVEIMLNEMYKLGAKKENIVAKIAGGGQILTSYDTRIGDKNVDFALQYCKQEGIKVVSEHTRGDSGRVILLTSDFDTFIRVVKNRAVEAEIESLERDLWNS